MNMKISFLGTVVLRTLGFCICFIVGALPDLWSTSFSPFFSPAKPKWNIPPCHIIKLLWFVITWNVSSWFWMELVGIVPYIAAFVKGLTESPSFTGKLIAKKSSATLVKSGFRPLHVFFFKKNLIKFIHLWCIVLFQLGDWICSTMVKRVTDLNEDF